VGCSTLPIEKTPDSCRARLPRARIRAAEAKKDEPQREVPWDMQSSRPTCGLLEQS
jgi:hypothetical protein